MDNARAKLSTKNSVLALVTKIITVIKMVTKVCPPIQLPAFIVAIMCGRANTSIETRTAAMVGQIVIE